MSTLSHGEAEAIRSSRGDAVAFVAAVLLGAALYAGLHVVLHLPQLVVTAAIIAVMLLYAATVVRVPRLRVRLDQAGDNAYYLGLLFTLMSMAFALYEFGTATTELTEGQQLRSAGVQQIISNFGIALASTITGIFLRVFLHQMRIDPGEVEGMTRIELAEASKRVRATLDSLTIDLGRFHEEIRQRSGDVVTALLKDAQELVGNLERELGRATKEVLESATAVQANIRERAEALGHSAGEMAAGLSEAVNRLRAVEPPPLTLARRLDKVSHTLETAGTQVERVAASLQATVQTAEAATTGMATASATLQNLAGEMKASHADTIQRIGLAVETVTAGLSAVGGRLEQERRLLGQLEEQSRRSAEESARAQAAAVEVLSRLTELTRGLTSALKEEKGTSGSDGNAQ
jgi:hypothetical protein